MNAYPILLIEDNQDDADLTMRAFKKSRISNQVIHFDDGVKALNFLFAKGEFKNRTRETFPGFVLLDLQLPKLNGIEILREIRSNELTRRLPVIILTSSCEESDIFNCYESGANSYIQKPVDYIQFTSAVEQLGLYWLLLNKSMT